MGIPRFVVVGFVVGFEDLLALVVAVFFRAFVVSNKGACGRFVVVCRLVPPPPFGGDGSSSDGRGDPTGSLGSILFFRLDVLWLSLLFRLVTSDEGGIGG